MSLESSTSTKAGPGSEPLQFWPNSIAGVCQITTGDVKPRRRKTGRKRPCRDFVQIFRMGSRNSDRSECDARPIPDTLYLHSPRIDGETDRGQTGPRSISHSRPPDSPTPCHTIEGFRLRAGESSRIFCKQELLPSGSLSRRLRAWPGSLGLLQMVPR